MARLNTLNLNFGPRTHEGAPARHISPELQLRRSVLACLLWESQFYEDGVEIGGRIAELVPKVAAEKVAALAVEAREQMKLRHAPLLLVREMARHKTHRALVSEMLARVIQRADELAEFVAIYWKDGRVPLSGQVKKGLAAAFPKFDEYQLSKYDRSGPIKLRDVLFLCHAKPRDDAQAGVWKKLIWGRLITPDTWQPSPRFHAGAPPARKPHRCAASRSGETAAQSSSRKRPPERWSSPEVSRCQQRTSASPVQAPPPSAERNALQPGTGMGARDPCSST